MMTDLAAIDAIDTEERGQHIGGEDVEAETQGQGGQRMFNDVTSRPASQARVLSQTINRCSTPVLKGCTENK